MGRISGGRHGRGQDGRDLLVVDHFPQPVGADQQDVLGSQREGRRLHFHGGFLAQTAIELIAAGVRIDLVRLDDARSHERGHHRVITCDLRESRGRAIEVEPTVTDMDDRGGRLAQQHSRHRGPHDGLLLLVALIHDPIGILDACTDQGKQRFRRALLGAQRARHVRNQGLDGEPTRCSPMALSSHPICHHEEDKRGRGG